MQVKCQTDTLRLTLAQATERLRVQSLRLAADSLNIPIAAAGEIQAGLRPNPQLQIEYNLYNPGNERIFEYSSSSQRTAQLQQLFELGGKRNKRITVAQLGARAARLEFYDLIRNLNYETARSFFLTYYTLRDLELYAREITPLQKLVATYQQQSEKGNVAKSEAARLKALLVNLQNEALDLRAQLYEYQRSLRILLRTDAFVMPLQEKHTKDSYEYLQNVRADSLVEQALQTRFDLAQAQNDVAFAEAMWALERSRAVPDINLGLVYDRNGSAYPQYTALTFGVTLPFFNRNQGAIRASEITRNRNLIAFDALKESVRMEVLTAYRTAQDVETLYAGYDRDFIQKFDELQDATASAFSKQNISLLEFVDYLETYKNTVRQFNRLRCNMRLSIANLNYAIGQESFRP